MSMEWISVTVSRGTRSGLCSSRPLTHTLRVCVSDASSPSIFGSTLGGSDCWAGGARNVQAKGPGQLQNNCGPQQGPMHEHRSVATHAHAVNRPQCTSSRHSEFHQSHFCEPTAYLEGYFCTNFAAYFPGGRAKLLMMRPPIARPICLPTRAIHERPPQAAAFCLTHCITALPHSCFETRWHQEFCCKPCAPRRPLRSQLPRRCRLSAATSTMRSRRSSSCW